MGRGKKFSTQSQSYDLSSALREAREKAYCKESIEAAQRAVALSRRRTFRSSLLQDLLHSSKREDSNRHFNNERTNALIAENAKRKRNEFLLDQVGRAQQLFKQGLINRICLRDGHDETSLVSQCCRQLARSMHLYDPESLKVIFRSALPPSALEYFSAQRTLHGGLINLNFDLSHGRQSSGSMHHHNLHLHDDSSLSTASFLSTEYADVLTVREVGCLIVGDLNDEGLIAMSSHNRLEKGQQPFSLKESWEEIDIDSVESDLVEVLGYSETGLATSLQELHLCDCVFSLSALSGLGASFRGLTTLSLHALSLDESGGAGSPDCVGGGGWDRLDDSVQALRVLEALSEGGLGALRELRLSHCDWVNVEATLLWKNALTSMRASQRAACLRSLQLVSIEGLCYSIELYALAAANAADAQSTGAHDSRNAAQLVQRRVAQWRAVEANFRADRLLGVTLTCPDLEALL